MRTLADPPQPLRVALHGFNERTRNTLLMFFEGKGSAHGRVVPDRESEVNIFDFDTLDGPAIWARTHQSEQRPALLLSVRERIHPNAIWVRKPLDCDNLIEALQSIRGHLAAASHEARDGLVHTAAAVLALPHGPAPQVSLASPANDTGQVPPPTLPASAGPARVAGAFSARPASGAPATDEHLDALTYQRDIRTYYGELDDATYQDKARRDDLFYDPDQYLQGTLARAMRRATRTGTAQSLEGLGKLLIVDPIRQQILTDMRDKYLRGLCLQSSRTLKIHLHPTTVPAEPTPDATWQDCDTALWRIALWCSRGRVPPGTALDAPIHLRAWPNFTRLANPPHAMQIIASWSRQPATLDETAASLGLPCRAVFTMYSACRALDLVETGSARAITRTFPETAVNAGVPRRLLGTLLRKLG